MTRYLPLSAILLFVIGCAGIPKSTSLADGDWPAYGRDGTGTRNSPLHSVDRSNVADLNVAWIYHTRENLTDALAEKAAFEATPIVVDGTMFVSTPSCRVIALDANTGQERWTFDPKVDRSADFSEVTSRGVSTWLDNTTRREKCRRRIYVGTIDARLIALDAKTGQPCGAFGAGGTVDLTRDITRLRPGQYQVTSPPAVLDDTIIVGSSIGDNGAAELERGVVRAYDARSGQLRWSWDPIADASMRTGAANAWAPISVDASRHMVFVPTSSPSPDYFGGLRKGDDRDANSVVALRGSDGKRVWGFQVVHHDLWDYDVASQPLLIDVPIDGRMRAAVAIGTKMGNVFVVDRDTGLSLFPVEERPVPQTDVEGEQSSPTQPFPTFPPPRASTPLCRRRVGTDCRDPRGMPRQDCGHAIRGDLHTPFAPGDGGRAGKCGRDQLGRSGLRQ
jgi:quinoprotein glucose dehydrogenase